MGKKTRGRLKIKMEYISDKLKRYTTFSKRRSGIMKKAYELSTLTGTEVLLLVASETGHVYTYATDRLKPIFSSDVGRQLIQQCLGAEVGAAAAGFDPNRAGQSDVTDVQLDNDDEDDEVDEDFEDSDNNDDSNCDPVGSSPVDNIVQQQHLTAPPVPMAVAQSSRPKISRKRSRVKVEPSTSEFEFGGEKQFRLDSSTSNDLALSQQQQQNLFLAMNSAGVSPSHEMVPKETMHVRILPAHYTLEPSSASAATGLPSSTSVFGRHHLLVNGDPLGSRPQRTEIHLHQPPPPPAPPPPPGRSATLQSLSSSARSIVGSGRGGASGDTSSSSPSFTSKS